VGILRARRHPDRVGHTVAFPEDYGDEFVDLFDRDRPPVTPAVYLCAQERCHRRPGWEDAEPVFVMANAPAEPLAGGRDPGVAERLREAVLARLARAGLLDPADRIVWERPPAGLADAFPGTRGAIYGSASNDAFAAFRRPPNTVRGVPGLYLASGSAHPGGGMPLCALSGLQAADGVLAQLGGSGR
jgi:phytoene dehydrogenase-like protein